LDLKNHAVKPAQPVHKACTGRAPHIDTDCAIRRQRKTTDGASASSLYATGKGRGTVVRYQVTWFFTLFDDSSKKLGPSCGVQRRSGSSPNCEFEFLAAHARNAKIAATAKISTLLRGVKTSR